MSIPATRWPGRDPLAGGKVEHVGLALDRYLTQAGDPRAYDRLMECILDRPVPKLYQEALARWQSELQRLPNIECRRFRVRGRMIVGIGGASVHEAGITLSRAHGMPFIPGSALKGLARHYAQRTLVAAAPTPMDHELYDSGGDGEPNAYSVLFGHQASAAGVRFFDAWYVPEPSLAHNPLHRDVITVHHPRYYGSQGQGHVPWDFDDPIPVPFISASGCYLVAVQGPTAEWARFAGELLTHALEQWGIGAKTASGYGRMTWLRPPPRVPHPLLDEIERMRPRDFKSQLEGKVHRWRQIEDGVDRRAVAAAIRDVIGSTPELRKWGANSSWAREVRDFLASAEGSSG